MPAPKGDEYWAKWAYGYCQVAKVSLFPNRDYAPMVEMKRKTVAQCVARLRENGIMVPKEQGIELTPRALAVLEKVRHGADNVVAFDLQVRARTKAEALTEVWDVISQLEHWDPRAGEPFRLRQARTKMLGAVGGYHED